METAFFSVIITTYNRPQKLIRAIQSVLDQTYKNFEIIIVNDGSTMDYYDVEKFVLEHSQLIKYYFKENEERSVARNYGVNKSMGQFICFLDDDDYYLQNHLQVFHDEISKQKYRKGLYHTYSLKYEKNNWSKNEILEKDSQITEQEYYLTGGKMTMNCSCFAKDVLIEFPYNPKFIMSEDTNQRLRALSKYPVFRIQKYTSVYDLSESSTKKPSIKNALEYRKTWLESFKDPAIKPYIKPFIQKAVLSDMTLSILNYYRHEISIIQVLYFLVLYFFYSPSKSRIIECCKLLYWRIKNK